MNNINNFYILSLWNLFETKILANGALDPPNTCFISSPEIKFSITRELTAPWVKSLFILYSKIIAINYYILGGCWAISTTFTDISKVEIKNDCGKIELKEFKKIDVLNSGFKWKYKNVSKIITGDDPSRFQFDDTFRISRI